MSKKMDHTKYPKSLKSKSEDSLRFIMADAHAAITAMPEGENAGYYADEVCYCGDELSSRAKINVLTLINLLIKDNELNINYFKIDDTRLTLPVIRSILDRCVNVLAPTTSEIPELIEKVLHFR